ncbi:unnamed protein product, partial [Prorocentrum cordatum]
RGGSARAAAPGRVAAGARTAGGGRPAGRACGPPQAGKQGAGGAAGQARGAGEQLLAELQRQAQEIRQSILQQEASLVRAAPAAPSAPAITTLVVRNIPMAATQRDLLDLIDRCGFARRYDFAYTPTDFDAGTTEVLVNFVTPGDAREFSEMWNGARLTGAGPAAAILEVEASQLQGYRGREVEREPVAPHADP